MDHSRKSYGNLSKDSELRELVAARCSGTATAQQWAELQQRLRTDPAAVEFYLAHVSLHASLALSFVEGDELPAKIEGISQKPQVVTRRRRVLQGVLAGTLTLVGLWMFMLLQPIVFGPPVLAWHLNQTDGGADVPLRSGDHVRLPQGSPSVRFRNGVEITLSGDAHLEVISDLAVRLHSGQLHADVGKNGRGFTVLTNSTEVVDLGTVFGVAVSPQSDTDVVVFSGEVQLGQGKLVSHSDHNLSQGEAVRVNSVGDKHRIPEIWQDHEASAWSTQKSDSVQSPIASVRDNLTATSRPKYYAIVPRGFREDAQVYVDRPYEWNGLTAAGLPQELVGADYIRTFNDDKYQADLEITLTLSAAANVYVLMDPRHVPPDWLTADFVDTGWQLGIDLGRKFGTGRERVPPLGVLAARYLGVGPGESVDVPFAVWKRTVPGAEEIRLGPNGAPSQVLLDSIQNAGSMYGIVVTPVSLTES